jgi:hypothetical protein
VEDFEDPGDIDEPEIDLENIEPYKFNWFKYLLDKYLQDKDEDGNVSALRSADAYMNLLNIVVSSKSSEAIQEELLDLVGFHNFTLLEQLVGKREEIKIYCSSLSEQMKEDRTQNQGAYRGTNMHMAPVTIGVTV